MAALQSKWVEKGDFFGQFFHPSSTQICSRCVCCTLGEFYLHYEFFCSYYMGNQGFWFTLERSRLLSVKKPIFSFYLKFSTSLTTKCAFQFIAISAVVSDIHWEKCNLKYLELPSKTLYLVFEWLHKQLWILELNENLPPPGMFFSRKKMTPIFFRNKISMGGNKFYTWVHLKIYLFSAFIQSCKMSQIWQIYLCKDIGRLG